MLRYLPSHIILPTSRSEGLSHKKPMFMGLSAIVIHSWEDCGKISAKVPFRSVDDFPPSELCELHELAPAARLHQPQQRRHDLEGPFSCLTHLGI
jgi:hypothetical protein